MKRFVLPLDELEVMEGEMIMVRGGVSDKKKIEKSGCGCGCGCGSGRNCGCGCRSTEMKVVGCRCQEGCGCGCGCLVEASDKDNDWKLV